MDSRGRGRHTTAVHAGLTIEPSATEPLAATICQSSVFAFPALDLVDAVYAGEKTGYIYTRYGNPNHRMLERAVADLEKAPAALSCSSGMAAAFAVVAALVDAGSHVVAAEGLYGGTYSLLANELPRFGVSVTFVDVADVAAVEAVVGPNTRLIFVETISNPLLRVADIPQVADIARRHGAKLCVDNTFATPYLVNPIELGADAVIHSATKYLGGHSDVVAGVVAGEGEVIGRARRLAQTVGTTLDPFAAWLTLRGLRTLSARMERHCRNAQAVADFLARHPAVRHVAYPGLPAHPEHALSSRMFRGGFGGIVSFELGGGAEAAAFVKSLAMCRFAPSLGDVATTVSHPAKTSHRQVPVERREAMGIGEGLIRLSVGIEDVADIIGDISQALERV